MVGFTDRTRVLWALAAAFAVATVLVSLVIVTTAGGSGRESGDPVATAPIDTVADADVASAGRHFVASTVTGDGGPPYALTASGSATGTGVVVTKPGADRTDNTREVFWDDSVPPSVDQLTCATWSAQAGPHDQQGAALRIQVTPTAMRAITVTKNVWFTGNVFNVHLWDTAKGAALPDVFAHFTVAPLLGPGGSGVQPLPWRLCARVTGRRLEFVVWRLPDPVPAWGDPRYGGGVDLPPGWDGPGRAGWYAGHLHAGDVVSYDSLRTSAGRAGPEGSLSPPPLN